MPGEIAEMMLDGTLCEGCGGFMSDAGEGSPRYCSEQCARDRGAPSCEPVARPQPNKADRARWRRQQNKPCYCPMCGCRKEGRPLADHIRDAHQMRMVVGATPRPMAEGDL